jgi:hypothetical protein
VQKLVAFPFDPSEAPSSGAGRWLVQTLIKAGASPHTTVHPTS